MGYFKAVLSVLFLWGVSLGWGQITGVDFQQHKEIEKTLADLRYLDAKLTAEKKDLAAAQSDLTTTKGRLLTLEEVQALRERIQKDEEDIRDDTDSLVKDMSLLRLNWATLTQEEKDLVLEIERNQT